MRRRSLVLYLPLLLAVAPSPSMAQLFVFHLRGDQEVPPVPSPASGGCMGVLDQGAATFDLTCAHNVASATLMHIHRAPAGANGPIVFDLGDPASPVQATWTAMTPADIADLLAADLYINIHTAGRPDGEIRGQVLERTVDSVNFTADGSQMVPPNASSSTATCVADLDGPATGLAIQCTHDVPSPDTAHVHSAPAGENGPVVFTFASPASPLSETMPMTPLLVADFAAAFLYLEIHAPGSEDVPGDEIRGQIGTPPSVPQAGTIRIVKQTFPPGGLGFAFSDDVPGGPAAFVLGDGGTQEFASVAPGTYSVTEADPAVTPGGFALSDLACDDADSTADPFTRTATVRLQALEVVTCAFRNFATAAGTQTFLFHLDGGQEAPPVASAARGGCFGQLDAGAGELKIICVHDVPGPTLIHIHRGAAGVNGPIVFDLGDPTSPVQATWSGMTPADVADLLAGDLYINIHTSGRPAGEIRGQMLPRTVDSFGFFAGGGQMAPPDPTPATGSCFADLDDPAASLLVACTHNLPLPTAAHLHEAPPGVNGPLVFAFASPLSPFAGNVPMTPRLLADFAAGFLYVEIHAGDPDEEGAGASAIRGQLVAAQQAFLEIPTLGQWGAVLLALALAALGWRRLAAAGGQ
jgi:hypothetical protein